MTERLEFRQIVIDPAQRIVRRREEVVELSDLGFDLLMALARHAPDPVSNRELAELVWQMPVVSDQTIAQRVAMVRRALGDDASNPTYIRTVRGRGYAWIAPPLGAGDAQDGQGVPERASQRPLVQWALVAAALVAVAGLVAFASRPEVSPLDARLPEGVEINPETGEVTIDGVVQRPEPILLDPENGALRLDNADMRVSPPAHAVVDGRDVLIAGLTDWELVKRHPQALSTVCALRADRSRFTTAIAPALDQWLDDPAKDADCA